MSFNLLSSLVTTTDIAKHDDTYPTPDVKKKTSRKTSLKVEVSNLNVSIK